MSETAGLPLRERSYRIISGDDDADRICSTIPDRACVQAPRNYLLNLLNGTASKLSEQIAGPRLVLPWLLSAGGAPGWIVSLLMPLRQAASLLPQLLVSGTIRAASIRKWYWVAAGVTQALCVLGMLAALWALEGIALGMVVLGLLAVFSIASGVASVAFQDVLAKTIGKGVRGSLLANRALAGGVLALGAGVLLNGWLTADADLWVAAPLLLTGALLWLVAAASFAATSEPAGATEGGRNPVAETRAGWQLMLGSAPYRWYLLTRFLLLSVELAAPLFVLLAQDSVQGGASLLGLLVGAMALADVLSSRIWGRMADRGAREVLLLAGCAGASAALLLVAMSAADALPAWSYAVAFLLLGVAEAGVRLGRKTWLVDASAAHVRPTAVAFANTLTGGAALLLGGLGLAGMVLASGPVLLVGLLALAGAAAAWALPKDALVSDPDAA